jgi:formate hydrogenlyase subunit 3/multisubunit Na+/H+ antiporter MnhD subunit
MDRSRQKGEGQELSGKALKTLNRASLIVALLQSLCTAVLTISGIRVAIGLSALAAASGIYAPARGWHQDAIRIPLLALAVVGALVNLAVLAWIWRLRAQPSAQWRRREITKEKRSERLQVVLAIVTLVLVGLETWTHPMVHRVGPRPTAPAQQLDRGVK